jgi:hypothetical protein
MTVAPQPPRPLPWDTSSADDFTRLTRPEQLIIWTLRTVAVGHGECPMVRRMFGHSFGAGADDAFMGFFIAVRTLGWCGRRKLRLHVPGCMAVSPDEREIVALFAEAQASLTEGDETEVRARLAHLVDSGAAEAVLLSLQTVAGALEACGYTLPRPRTFIVANPTGAPPRLLH